MTAPVAPRRVTVVGPTARVDVSLPAQSTVAELLPMLVRMSVGERAGTGWTLGRLGTEPLDGSSTVSSAGIRDGELLYLSSREAQPAPLVFDDVVDAIASAAADRRDAWRPALSRAVGLVAAVLAFGGSAVLAAVARPPWPLGSAVDGLLAILLLLVGATLARAFGDSTAGAAIAAAGLPASFLAGVGLVLAQDGNPLLPGPGPLAAGCAILTVYAVLAAVAVPDRLAWFAAAAAGAATGCLAALSTVVTGVRASSAAGVVTAGALVLSPILPMLSLRLGRLPLPRVPTDTAAFRRDETPTLGPEVAENTETAEKLLTGLLAAVAAVAVGGTVVLLAEDTIWPRALAVLAGTAMLLRARAYTGVGQRGAMLLGGAVVLVATAASAAANGSGPTRAAVIVAVLVLGLISVVYAIRAPANQPSPYWTRLLDVVEFLALVSLVPLAAAVLDLYQAARSLGG
jgi:type VII secretion integral membrane protein EccD